MPILKTVAVIGSYRSAEVEKYHFSPNISFFKQATEAFGSDLARSGHGLVSAWSNDHLAAQLLGGRYRFEDTADYCALIGYLQVLLGDPNYSASRHVKLYISDEMWDYGVTNPNGVSIPISAVSVGNTNVNLAECVERAIIKKYKIPGDEVENLLRSEMLRDYVISNADIVISLGGGKATSLVADSAIAKGKFLPLGFFGGASRQSLIKIEGDPNTRALADRINSVIGNIPREFEKLERSQILYSLSQIAKHLDRFVLDERSVFIAMPFRNSVNMHLGYKHLDVYHAIDRALKSLKEKWRGLRLIRVDRVPDTATDIPQNIQAAIRQCGVFIADLTEIDTANSNGMTFPNANVWWELGFADGLGKKRIILLAQEGTPLPFNNRVRNVKFWSDVNDIESAVRESVEAIFKEDNL